MSGGCSAAAGRGRHRALLIFCATKRALTSSMAAPPRAPAAPPPIGCRAGSGRAGREGGEGAEGVPAALRPRWRPRGCEGLRIKPLRVLCPLRLIVMCVIARFHCDSMFK